MLWDINDANTSLVLVTVVDLLVSLVTHNKSLNVSHSSDRILDYLLKKGCLIRIAKLQKRMMY